MTRGALVLLGMLTAGMIFAGEDLKLGDWSYTFSETKTESPPAGLWQSFSLPGNFDRLASESEGYFWLRKQISLGEEPGAVILGPAGISYRVYLDSVLIGSQGSSGDSFIAPMGLYRGYSLPFNEAEIPAYHYLYIRLYHYYHSWIEGGVWLIPLKDLTARLILKNFFSLLLRAFLIPLLFFLFILSFYSYFIEKNPYFIFIGLLSFSGGISGLFSSFFTFIFPFSVVIRLFSFFNISTGILAVLFVVSYLQMGRIKLFLVLLSPLVLIGLAGIFSNRIESLLTIRFFEIWVGLFTLLVGAGLTAFNFKKNPSRAVPLIIFYLVILSAFSFQFLRSGPTPKIFRSYLPIEIILVVFVIWIIQVELYKKTRLYSGTTEELVDRVEADWELIEKLKDGKGRLEKRNLESMSLSGRLMDGAQEQARSIGRIMHSIEEGASAEDKVIAKEKEILDSTIKVDSRIIDFNRRIQEALKELKELQRKSQTITKAVAQIIDIADKTHRLSLNASIEASKAGEAGGGFAVIANQIRKLADLTRRVSDHVNAMIRESNLGVEKGVQMVQSLEKGYEGIMSQSENIRRMIEHNSLSLEEVSRAHQEIQDGVAGVDRTIKTILEVSRDLRQMTISLADTFSWFDEALRVEKAGGKEALPSPVEAAEISALLPGSAERVTAGQAPLDQVLSEPALAAFEEELQEDEEAEELEEIEEEL